MKVDTENGEYVRNNTVYVGGRNKDDGFDHESLQGTFCIAQRHMDEKEVTPVNINIGDWEIYEGGYEAEYPDSFPPG
jgi:hypothetical protein